MNEKMKAKRFVIAMLRGIWWVLLETAHFLSFAFYYEKTPRFSCYKFLSALLLLSIALTGIYQLSLTRAANVISNKMLSYQIIHSYEQYGRPVVTKALQYLIDSGEFTSMVFEGTIEKPLISGSLIFDGEVVSANFTYAHMHDLKVIGDSDVTFSFNSSFAEFATISDSEAHIVVNTGLLRDSYSRSSIKMLSVINSEISIRFDQSTKVRLDHCEDSTISISYSEITTDERSYAIEIPNSHDCTFRVTGPKGVKVNGSGALVLHQIGSRAAEARGEYPSYLISGFGRVDIMSGEIPMNLQVDGADSVLWQLPISYDPFAKGSLTIDEATISIVGDLKRFAIRSAHLNSKSYLYASEGATWQNVEISNSSHSFDVCSLRLHRDSNVLISGQKYSDYCTEQPN